MEIINRLFKIILSFLIVLSLKNNIIAQVSYNITFEKDNFSFMLNSDENYDIIPNEESYFFIGDTTLPALPYTAINILVPKDVEIRDLKINTKDIIILQNINLSRNPQLVTASDTSNFSSNSSRVNYTNKRYPDTNVQFLSVNKMQDFHFASFSICPFIYDNENKILSMITNLNISFQYDQLSSTKTNVRERYEMEDIVRNIVINPNELKKIVTTKELQSKSTSSEYSMDIEYLIITSEALSSSFNPLKAWKIKKGIRTEILTTNYIYANYTGATNQLKIKNCLKDYYENKNLKWVLLGGDNTIIPVQGCYGKVNDKVDNTIPCDLFYACFDNAFDWNANGNGIIGERDDNIDMAPEIFISRAPVRTSVHVSTFINKTLNYEQNPPLSNYAKTLLLAGSQLWNTWDGQSDAHQRSEAMYSQHIAPYWTGVRTRFYDTYTDFSGGADYNLTASNLQTALNSGYHFVNTAVHGNATVFGLESGSFTSTNAANLTNSNNSIITTMACNTNRFDDNTDPCLSEAFLRNSNGGCVCYWGGSRYGWGYSNQTIALGASLDYIARFYRNLFTGTPTNNNFRFGAVTAQAKSYYIGLSHNVNYPDYRWVQFSQNAIGDPELSIYTENPSIFSTVTITQTCTTVIVNTGGISGCDIALTSQDMGNSYFEVRKNVSSATFTGVDCSFYITITKHNYKPFLYQKNLTDRYIQNYIFTTNTCVTGKNIFAGKNVTSTQLQGEVIVKNGANVYFAAEQDVLLDGGFEVELGGSFEIQ